MLRRAGDEEEQRKHAGAEDRHVLDDVEVGEHGCLAVKLIIDVGLGGVGAGSGAGRDCRSDVEPASFP